MVLFRTLLGFIIDGINAAFTSAEDIFSAFGITLLVLVVAMVLSTFFVRHFIGSFIK